MPRYVIERNMPGAGDATPAELKEIAAKSNAVLHELGPDVHWEHSYVSADKIFCVYIARDEEIVRKHAELTGFPADTICEVKALVDPVMGEPNA
ncbi:DUF4242 domain-containing protein [bacterium]|nr:DUF4242 domain-containing protein [bacterium]